jgi:hypothetical protein
VNIRNDFNFVFKFLWICNLEFGGLAASYVMYIVTSMWNVTVFMIDVGRVCN